MGDRAEVDAGLVVGAEQEVGNFVRAAPGERPEGEPADRGVPDQGGHQPEGKDGRAANELTFTDWDPVSKQPLFKSAAAQVERIEGSGSGGGS